MLRRRFFRVGSSGPKRSFRIGKPVAFELHGFTRSVLSHEYEIAIIGDQNLAISSPIAADLFAVGGKQRIVRSWLDFDHSARGGLRKGFFLTL